MPRSLERREHEKMAQQRFCVQCRTMTRVRNGSCMGCGEGYVIVLFPGDEEGRLADSVSYNLRHKLDEQEFTFLYNMKGNRRRAPLDLDLSYSLEWIHGSQSVDWAMLPPDILGSVARCGLGIDDIFCISCVCKAWKKGLQKNTRLQQVVGVWNEEFRRARSLQADLDAMRAKRQVEYQRSLRREDIETIVAVVLLIILVVCQLAFGFTGIVYFTSIRAVGCSKRFGLIMAIAALFLVNLCLLILFLMSFFVERFVNTPAPGVIFQYVNLGGIASNVAIVGMSAAVVASSSCSSDTFAVDSTHYCIGSLVVGIVQCFIGIAAIRLVWIHTYGRSDGMCRNLSSICPCVRFW